MERWVLATLFASGSEPRDVYINVLFVTKMERVDDHTEVEFSSGTKISVMDCRTDLSGTSQIVHRPCRKATRKANTQTVVASAFLQRHLA